MVYIEWRKYSARSRTGQPYEASPFYPQNSGALLLWQILQMPQEGKVPLDYDVANDLVATEVCRSIDARNFAQVEYLTEHWVEWLSSQGYYIVVQEADYMISREVEV